MSVSQARQQAVNGTSTHSSRRRRRGGSTATTTASRPPTTLLQQASGRRTTSGGNNGGGTGGRGIGRRTIWEENTVASSATVPAAVGRSQKTSTTATPAPAAAVRDQGSKNKNGGGQVVGVGGPAVAPAPMSGNGFDDVVRKVHPGMLESEFLAATGQANAGVESGVVPLSLEEVPYDRDLRWCNTASDSRPRPKMDPYGGVFGRVGTAITHDTGDYERLDSHYQELWKDREENGPPSGRGGRGGGRVSARGSSGGRSRGGRGSGGVGGRSSNSLRGRFTSTTGRGGGRGDGPVATRRGGLGRVGGRGGRAGASSGSPFSSSGEAVGAGAEATRASGSGERGGSSGQRKRGQRVNGANNPMLGRGSGGGGGDVGGNGGGRASSVPQSSPSAIRTPSRASAAPHYDAQGGPAASRQLHSGGGDGLLPSQALNNVRSWSEGRDRQPQQEKYYGPLGTGQGPWSMETSTSPQGPAAGAVVNSGGGNGLGTPPLVTAIPSLLSQNPQTESHEYLGDLANALGSTPPPLYAGDHLQHQHQQPPAVVPPLGPSLLVGGNNLFGGGWNTPKHTSSRSSTLSPYLSPAQSNMLADPSIDVDIQDICADPDLNADAPAFVPGGY